MQPEETFVPMIHAVHTSSSTFAELPGGEVAPVGARHKTRRRTIEPPQPEV
jgi:hypothetical protein